MSPTLSHLQLIQNEKFYSRVLSKEEKTSASNPSFRVYYGVAAGSVPFLWESQPGTPKHSMADSSLPPLTPPPSFYFSPHKKANFIKSQKQSFFQSMLPKLRKPHPPGSHRRARSSSSTISSYEEEQEEGFSPISTLCVGGRRGCYSMIGVKKALLSIVGSGSNHGSAP